MVVFVMPGSVVPAFTLLFLLLRQAPAVIARASTSASTTAGRRRTAYLRLVLLGLGTCGSHSSSGNGTGSADQSDRTIGDEQHDQDENGSVHESGGGPGDLVGIDRRVDEEES